jgi:hypothetical protein
MCCCRVVCVYIVQFNRGDLISAKILAVTVVKGVIKAVTLTTEPSLLAPPSSTNADTAPATASKSKKSKKANKASTAASTAQQQQQSRVSWTEALPHTKLPQEGSVYR